MTGDIEEFFFKSAMFSPKLALFLQISNILTTFSQGMTGENPNLCRPDYYTLHRYTITPSSLSPVLLSLLSKFISKKLDEFLQNLHISCLRISRIFSF